MSKRKDPKKTENIYKKARLTASEDNAELETVEKASSVVRISREKLGQIEQEDPHKLRDNPEPDEVASMIRHYRAPELRNHYCTHLCPLGKGMPTLEYENLHMISLQLILAIQRIDGLQDRLGDILADGQIGNEELEEFRNIVSLMKNVATQAESLELWAQKNGLLP